MLRIAGRCAVLVAILAACASAPDPPNSGGPETIQWAKDVMGRGHYRVAAEALERLVLNFPDRQFSDEAQFLLGEAHMGLEEYILAENAFRLLIDSYPSSQFRDDAELGIALCYKSQSPNYRLDQSSTLAAERALTQFIEDHPSSPLVPRAEGELRAVRERLARKLLESARFYLRRGKTDSAKIYLQRLDERFPGTRAAVEAQYLMGGCHEKEKSYQEAARLYTALLDELPDDDPLRKDILERLAELRKRLDEA